MPSDQKDQPTVDEVREFAEAVRRRFHEIAKKTDHLDEPVADDFCWAGLEVKELAAARGVKLDETP